MRYSEGSRRVAEEREKQPYIELDADLLLLAAEGGDRNLIEALRRIRVMSAVARRELRQAIERLDGLLDEVALEIHLQRRTTGSSSNG